MASVFKKPQRHSERREQGRGKDGGRRCSNPEGDGQRRHQELLKSPARRGRGRRPTAVDGAKAAANAVETSDA